MSASKTYTPILSSSEDDKDTFYDQTGLQRTLLSNNLVVLRDSNSYYMAHSADNKLGNSVNGNYTGAVGMVQREEADMVMGPLALNIRRRDVLEYSYGYIYSKTSMLYRRNTHTQPDVFTLIKPFEPKVWLGVLLAVMFVAGAAIFFNRFHATLRHDTVSGASNQRSTDSEFVAKSILWTWKIFFAQDLTDSPRGHSGHVLTIFWLVISFMIASMYRCNLRAILIDEVKAPFTNTKEFVERDDYTVTWIKGKAYKPYLKERLQWFPDEPLGKLWHMRTDPVSAENFVSTVANNKIAGLAINLALRAFTADDFSQHGECRVAVAESDVVTVYMSYGFPRHSILRESVDSVLLRLVQSGIPEQMQRNNTRNADLCFKPQTSKESRPIAVKDLMGTFLICGIG
ncbi:Ionotropic glutamate receptor L-glutamate and glycine-binding domain [Trinorchestia longiramus]|nr:Ionotropic glutamate receptor L-glutamate and glycine-binding domain [Trinorchestia longiramus]